MRFVTIRKSHILLDYYVIVLSIIVQLVQYKFNRLRNTSTSLNFYTFSVEMVVLVR